MIKEEKQWKKDRQLGNDVRRAGIVSQVAHISIREVEGLTIIFWDARTIYVKTTFGNWVVFHRWFHIQRNFCTKNFKPFSKKLRHNKHLSYTYIANMAIKYDITIASAREPKLDGKIIKILPSKGRNRNKED